MPLVLSGASGIVVFGEVVMRYPVTRKLYESRTQNSATGCRPMTLP